MDNRVKDHLLVCAGAVVGGLIGFWGFVWIVGQGLYALILPGALAGLGAGVARNHSLTLAVGCGLFALSLGLVAEWKVFPFVQNDSIGYFLAHLHQLRPLTMLLIGAGGFIGFWIPFRRRQEMSKRAALPNVE